MLCATLAGLAGTAAGLKVGGWAYGIGTSSTGGGDEARVVAHLSGLSPGTAAAAPAGPLEAELGGGSGPAAIPAAATAAKVSPAAVDSPHGGPRSWAGAAAAGLTWAQARLQRAAASAAATARNLDGGKAPPPPLTPAAAAAAEGLSVGPLPGGVRLEDVEVTLEGQGVLPATSAAAAPPPPPAVPAVHPTATFADVAEPSHVREGPTTRQRITAKLSGAAATAASAAATAAGGSAAAAEALASFLWAGEQREALGSLAPAWAALPDYEKASALNQLIALLWPQLAAYAEVALREQLAAAAAAVAGGAAPGLAALEVAEVTLGPAAPPRLGGIKAAGGWGAAAGGGGGGGGGAGGGEGETLVIEADVAWAADAQIAVTLTPGLPPSAPGRAPRLALPLPLSLSASRLALRARARISLGPLLPHPPYLAAAAVTLLEPPEIAAGLTLGLRRRRNGSSGGGSGTEGVTEQTGDGENAEQRAGKAAELGSSAKGGGAVWGVDLLAIPGLGWLATAALQAAVQRAVLFPRHVVAHLVPGGGLPPPPPGLLRLRLLRAEGLAGLGPAGAGAAGPVEGGAAEQEAAGAGAGGVGLAPGTLLEWGSGSGSEVYVTVQVREGAAQRSPPRPASANPRWDAPASEPGSSRVSSATASPLASPRAAAAPSASHAFSPSFNGGGGGPGGGGGGAEFTLPVAADGSGRELVVRLMRDERGWDDRCLAHAHVPLDELLPALRQRRRAAAAERTVLYGSGLASSTSTGASRRTAAYDMDCWSPLVLHLTADRGAGGGGGGLGAVGGAIGRVAAGAIGVPLRGIKGGAGATMGSMRKMGRKIKDVLTGSKGKGRKEKKARAEAEAVESAKETELSSAPAALQLPSAQPSEAGSTLSSSAPGAEAWGAEVLVFGSEGQLRRPIAGRIILEAQYLDLDRPQQPTATTTAPTTTVGGGLEAEREALSGSAAAASACVVGAPDAHALAAAAGASAVGAAGPVAGSAAGTVGGGGGGGRSAEARAAGGSGGVRVEVGALWPSGPARAMRGGVAADEQGVVAVRVLRLRQLVAGSNRGAAGGVDPFVELLLLDAAGRVSGAQRTPPRFNAPTASWEELELELAPAQAGGSLVARAWDKTTGWESLGRLARLDVGGARSDQLLGEVRLPLAALAAAGRLRRRWLLQPAGSRTATGAADIEMLLTWTPVG
ncbi:hypothetical protein HYH03_017742 [Edaphochlamys debaryana]|uniref:C2 domain-containing protein n=1 Tax=Edaphochlamys debaryana TaxID=47281 RepID=A0A835XHD7_9CHLO|nr:hypothetical protein HYH03_017742 [Edaphochlamys debaryana]|eukprot:KAG2483390.1 hypothetical protein HYH03_017742 [Edaphochlamys debaryana]